MKTTTLLPLLALLAATGCQKNGADNQSGTTNSMSAPASPGDMTTNLPPASQSEPPATPAPMSTPESATPPSATEPPAAPPPAPAAPAENPAPNTETVTNSAPATNSQSSVVQ